MDELEEAGMVSLRTIICLSLLQEGFRRGGLMPAAAPFMIANSREACKLQLAVSQRPASENDNNRVVSGVLPSKRGYLV